MFSNTLEEKKKYTRREENAEGHKKQLSPVIGIPV